MNSLVSIIIPCYNQSQYLPNAVNAVLNQTYINWECIIVNDGSTDNTQEVANEFVNRDKRIRLLNKSNGGLSSARNAGLENALGDFIQLLDADDFILPAKIEEQLNGLLSIDGDLSICDYKKINFADQQENIGQYGSPYLAGNILHQLIEDWEITLSIPCHCVLFRNTLINKPIIRFNEKLPNHEDWVFWVEVFNQNPKVHQLNKVLCYYYYYETSMSANRKWMGAGFIKAIDHLTKYFSINHSAGSDEIIKILSIKREKVLLKYARYNKSILQVMKKKVNRFKKIFNQG